MNETEDEILMGHEPHQFKTRFSVSANCGYTYVFKKEHTRRRSRRWCSFVCNFMPVILRVFCGFEIKGRENLAQLPEGAVSVCNHVHPLDCVALACAFWKRDTFFFSQRENFGIPVVRHLIRILKAMPMPENHEAYEQMLSQLYPEVHDSALFQVYPEGSLRTDCMLLRDFKPGAFRMADALGVPVLPCAIKIIHGKHRTKRILSIGSPVFADAALPEKQRIEKFMRESHRAMQAML